MNELIFVCRANGKQPPKNIKHRQKGASKSDFHQANVRESSEISNPEEIATSKAEEMSSGNNFKGCDSC